jgi:hypothetical protein
LDDLPNDEYVDIVGTTYTLLPAHNKRTMRVSDPLGCTITCPPTGLPVGYAITIYRDPTGGTVTFTSTGTLEGVITTISVAETYAIVSQRALGIFVIAGASSGGGGGASDFIDLGDVPGSYAGHANKLVAVNGTATGLEFITAVTGGTVTSVTGTSNRITITGTPTVAPVVDIAATYVGQASITTLGTITTGSWNGTSISTGFTDAKVVSISGVTNRTTISGTTTGPIVDISATYVGQASITILGTVATGVWNATTIGVTKGGTGLTSIGTANQVLGVNSGATGLEYKTITTGTTAVSNNVGITHAANSLVLQIPDASAVVRGVVTTATQTFAGSKTFTGNNSSANGFRVDSGSSAGILLYTDPSVSTNYIQGYGSNNLFISSASTNTLNLFGRQMVLNVTGAGTEPITIVSTAALQTPKNFVALGATFANSITTGLFTQLLLNGIYNQTTGSTSVNQRDLLITPTINNPSAGANSTHYGILYAPIETFLTNTTHYGFVSNSTTALSGFGTATPTALVHIGAATTARSSLRISAGVAPTTGIQDGDVWHATNHLYARLNGVTYQLDQQAGGGGVTDGDKGDVTVTSSGTVWTIDNDAVTYAKIQNVSATSRFLGRITSGAGDIEEMTGTQATTLLDVFTTALKGLVPAATGGNLTTEFLRKDGSWAVPTGGGGGITNGAANTELTMSDGTNLDPSGVFIPSAGNLTLGSISIAGSRTISVENSGGAGDLIFKTKSYADDIYLSSDTTFLGDSGNGSGARYIIGTGSFSDIDINIYPKGSAGGGSAVQLGSSGTNGGFIFKFSGDNTSNEMRFGIAGDTVKGVIIGEPGNSAANSGRNLDITGASAYATSGNGNGGDINITSGLRRTSGSGVDGDININSLLGTTAISGALLQATMTAVAISSGSGNATLSSSTGHAVLQSGDAVDVLGDSVNINTANSGGDINIGTGTNAGNIIITVNSGESRYVVVVGLPTSNPGGTGRFWNDGGTVKIT